VNRLILTLIAGGLIVGGCGAEFYKQQADAQVEVILQERKSQALGYQPETEVAQDAPSAEPFKRAYDRVPVSHVALPTTSPMEPIRPEPLRGPYGPDKSLVDLPEVESENVVTAETARAAGREPSYGPPTPWRRAKRLDLFGVLEYAVQHSRSYKDQMDEVYLTALDVTLERHLFTPRPFARASALYTGGQGDVNYRSALTATAAAGVRQRLPYGGEVVAEGLVRFVDAINGQVDNGESASVALSGSVPLLRGAGLVNLEALVNAERQIVYQIRAFEHFRRSFVVDIASQYFRLLAQQQSVNNRLLNLSNLTALTERTEALYAAGRIRFLDVQRALQAQLSAESSLVDAETAYQSALDDFKVALGMPVEEPVDVIPVLLDVEVPRPDPKEAIELAERYRLDLQTSRDRINDAHRGTAVAANGLLPDLDLTAKVTTGNSVGTPAVQFDSRALAYEAGVTLELPLDRVAERNVYRASLVALQRSQRTYEQQRDVVVSDVRDSLRSIRDAQTSLIINQRGIELAERRLELTNDLLKQGGGPGLQKVDSRDVVDAQTSLLTAQDLYERARSQLQIRVLEYLRNTGTLRVNPRSGSIGLAMDRQTQRNRPPVAGN